MRKLFQYQIEQILAKFHKAETVRIVRFASLMSSPNPKRRKKKRERENKLIRWYNVLLLLKTEMAKLWRAIIEMFECGSWSRTQRNQRFQKREKKTGLDSNVMVSGGEMCGTIAVWLYASGSLTICLKHKA